MAGPLMLTKHNDVIDKTLTPCIVSLPCQQLMMPSSSAGCMHDNTKDMTRASLSIVTLLRVQVAATCITPSHHHIHTI